MFAMLKKISVTAMDSCPDEHTRCPLARDAITAPGLQKVDAFAFPIDATAHLCRITTRHAAPFSRRSAQIERPLGDRSQLFAQRQHLVLPVARLDKPGKRGGKGWVGPAPRQPGRIVNHA